MENTLMIGVVSLLCIFAHVPSLLLRIVPFHEKISAKDKCRLTVKETIGVGVNEKAALSSDKNCPFVYINFDFTLVNKVASL